jgi:hypothetical protein
LKKSFQISLLAVVLLTSGCGPKPEEICGTALTGAVLYAVLAWALLLAVHRAVGRITSGAWPPLERTRGVWFMVGGFSVVSGLAWWLAPQVAGDTVGVVWACVGGNLLTWALLLQCLVRWTPAGVVLVAGVLSLGPAVGGAMGVEILAQVSIFQWFYGGFLGAVPGAIILIILLVAWLRRRPTTG